MIKLEKEEFDRVVYAESFDDTLTQSYSVKSNKTKRGAAKIWKYMGALYDEQGKLIDNESVYCGLCVANNTIKKYNKQVSHAHLYAHLKRLHGIEIERTQPPGKQSFTCDLCGACASNKIAMKTHMINKHIGGNLSNSNDLKVNLNKRANGKSVVWNYFGELYDQFGQHIDPSHTYCRICVNKNVFDSKYSTTSSTSVLSQHLQKFHKIGHEKTKETRIERKAFRTPNQPISTELVHNASGFAVNCYKASLTGSFAWYFFGKLVDVGGAPIDHEKKFYFCKLCVQDENLKTKYVTNCSTSNLMLHLRNVHGVEQSTVERSLLLPLMNDPSKFEESIEKTCNICNAKFSTRKAYFIHLRTLHKDMEPTDFICHVCSKTFTKSYMLTKHMRVHEKPKYNCSQCPASFTFPENLKRHENIHDPNHYRRFQCDRCSKSYSELKALQHHIRNVHLNVVRERNFPCLQCDMKFYGANHLR